MLRRRRLFISAGMGLLLCACAGTSRQLDSAGYGPTPALPLPQKSLLPVVNIAPAVGWQGEERPTVAPGLAVTPFARDLVHPRWLHVLPNGDVLVAETNAPPKPDDGKGLRGWVMKKVMARAGAGVPSANRIRLLRDADGDGRAETRTILIENLNSPFGMALVGNELYVANSDAILRFPYETGALKIAGRGSKLVDLPAGTLNHHWTKNLLASQDGRYLFVTVGSNSNVAENGMDQERNRAAILEVQRDTGSTRVFASGIRNPNGLAWEPQSGVLWTVVNERDDLGHDLVPDYLTSVKEGGFYGWPYSYFGQHVDARVKPPRLDLVASAIVPDYALGSHTGSLGLAFASGKLLLPRYASGAFVGQHGSWNRRPRSGYKVIFIPFAGGKPAGSPQDVLTDFVGRDGRARGRPVGVAIDRTGALLVADDVGNVVWRVAPSGGYY